MSNVVNQFKGPLLGLVAFCVGCRLMYVSTNQFAKSYRKFKKQRKMIKALSAVEDDNQKIVRSKEDLLMLDFERKKSFYTFVSGKVSPFFKLDNESKKRGLFERSKYLPWHDFSHLYCSVFGQ